MLAGGHYVSVLHFNSAKGILMKLIWAFVVASMVGVVLADDNQQPKERVPELTKERPMSFWMAQKIDLSKKILESLTKEDFAMIEADANQLRLLGRIEGFVRRKDPAYRRHQQSFESALFDIATQARQHNVEGATLAFNQLTTSCVVCHKTLREHPEDAPVSSPEKK